MKRDWVALAVCCSVISACGQVSTGKDDKSANNSLAQNPVLVLATGWDEIEMLAAYAKTTIDSSGHFVTSYNKCYHDGSGALTAQDWNNVADAVNASIKSQSPTPPTPDTTSTSDSQVCVPFPTDGSPTVDSYAKVKLNNGQVVTLLENRGVGICSSVIKDQAIANKLVSSLSRVITVAATEDCSGALRAGDRRTLLNGTPDPQASSSPSPTVGKEKPKGKRVNPENKQKQENPEPKKPTPPIY